MSSVACPTVQYFSTLAHKRHDFQGGEGEVIEHKTCVFIFYTNFAGNIFHSEKHWARCDEKDVYWSSYNVQYRYACQILMKRIFSTCFRKYSNIRFHKNPSVGSRVVACVRADMAKLIVAFRKFANAPEILERSPHTLPSCVRITIVFADLSKISRHSS